MTANPRSTRPCEPERLGLDTLYRRPKAISGRRLAGESLDHTLQATALANAGRGRATAVFRPAPDCLAHGCVHFPAPGPGARYVIASPAV